MKHQFSIHADITLLYYPLLSLNKAAKGKKDF